MTTIATFQAPEEAHLFSAFVGAAGIRAVLFDENFIQWFWYYSNVIGGVRVVVSDEDSRDANEAYRTYMEGLRDGPYPLRPVRGWPLVALLSLLVGAPFMIFGRRSS